MQILQKRIYSQKRECNTQEESIKYFTSRKEISGKRRDIGYRFFVKLLNTIKLKKL